jgi:hypothetical protein
MTLTLVNAVEVTITPVGEAFVFADYVDTALATMEDDLSTYLGTIGLGGETVYLSQVIDAIQYDGDEVRNANITSPAADVVLNAGEVPVRGSLAGVVITSV